MSSLENLHDVIVPDPVRFVPQTTGWWVVLGLLLLGLSVMSLKALRKHRANRYRREALRELERIESAWKNSDAGRESLADLPALVKRIALTCYPRSDVASLTGEAWLGFLDASYGEDGFTRGPGRLLPVLAYAAPDDPNGADVSKGKESTGELIALVRHWIRRHRVRV